MMLRELDFSFFIQQKLEPWLEQFPMEFFSVEQDIQLAYRHFIHSESKPRKLIILVNGRAENVIKSCETAYDFYHHGYDVLVFDHRGQGFSTRLLEDHEKGYIENFDDYINDMDKILQKTTALFHYQEQIIVAHSLGGLISCAYLANFSHQIKKLVLSAPFFDIYSTSLYRDKCLIYFFNQVGLAKHYVFGKQPYQPTEILNSRLSSSISRLKWMNQVSKDYPHCRLGGPTFHWVKQCLNASKHLKIQLSNIRIPVLIFQGEREKIVNNLKIQQYAESMPYSHLKWVENAKHEMLFETDNIRCFLFKNILAFL